MLAKKTGVLYNLPTTIMKQPAEFASTLDIANGMFLLIIIEAPLV
jgi:hypothetical protein